MSKARAKSTKKAGFPFVLLAVIFGVLYLTLSLLHYKAQLMVRTQAPRRESLNSPQIHPIDFSNEVLLPPEPVPTTESLTYPLAGFEVNVPAGAAYQIPGVTVQVRTSSLPDTCLRVGNVSQMGYMVRGSSGEDKDFRGFTAWSQEQLEFANQESMKTYLKMVSQIQSLSSTPDGVVRIDDFVAPGSFWGCDGAWFYPTYKQEIKNTKFERVVYLEVNSGNGEVISPPHQYLFITHNSDWLVASQGPSDLKYQDFWKKLQKKTCGSQEQDVTQCNMKIVNTVCTVGDIADQAACVAKIWETDRSTQRIQDWAAGILSQIE